MPAIDPTEWRSRLNETMSAYHRRHERRTATRADFRSARRQGVHERNALRLARQDLDASCAEVSARWAERAARSEAGSPRPAASAAPLLGHRAGGR